MRSIGARLTLGYALSAAASLSMLCALGYQLQQRQLFQGLDQISYANFEQLRARLGSDSANLDSATLRRRLRETTEYSAALFYIVVENPRTGARFRSDNLKGAEIPDIRGRRTYDAVVPGVGEARVNEYLLPPLDVTIATPTRPVRESMRAYVRACAALVALMLVMSGVIGVGLSRLLLAPVRLIRETAGRIGSDNLGERVPVGRVRDELSSLAELLNQMFDRLEIAFAQITRFSQDASHELKTPLSLIRLHAERMLAQGGEDARTHEALVTQIEEIGRLNQIIDDLLFISRAEVNAVMLDRRRVDPQAWLATLQADAAVIIEHHGLSLDFRNSARGWVDMDGKWIRQVLLNLVSNAIQASRAGGRIRIEGRTTATEWVVSVSDQGVGAAEADLERMFERFVRLGQDAGERRGSGLGLAISRSVMRLHGGAIAARRNRGPGLCVSFRLPLWAEAAVAGASGRPRPVEADADLEPPGRPARLHARPEGAGRRRDQRQPQA